MTTSKHFYGIFEFVIAEKSLEVFPKLVDYYGLKDSKLPAVVLIHPEDSYSKYKL